MHQRTWPSNAINWSQTEWNPSTRLTSRIRAFAWPDSTYTKSSKINISLPVVQLESDADINRNVKVDARTALGPELCNDWNFSVDHTPASLVSLPGIGVFWEWRWVLSLFWLTCVTPSTLCLGVSQPKPLKSSYSMVVVVVVATFAFSSLGLGYKIAIK